MFCDKREISDTYNDSPVKLEQRSATEYRSEIQKAILNEREPGEAERGLMTYYGEEGSLNEKIYSLLIDVEIHGGELWAVATLDVSEPLAPDELNTLRDYIEGQYVQTVGARASSNAE